MLTRRLTHVESARDRTYTHAACSAAAEPADDKRTLLHHWSVTKSKAVPNSTVYSQLLARPMQCTDNVVCNDLNDNIFRGGGYDLLTGISLMSSVFTR
jgi:hypothetical protein